MIYIITNNKTNYPINNMTHRDLYQIFYETNKFDLPNDIVKLKPYFYKFTNPDKIPFVAIPIVKMDTDTKIEEKKLVEIIEKDNNVNVNVNVNVNAGHKEDINKLVEINPSANTNNNIIEPKQKDSIFWCIFIFVYGYSEYLMVGSKYGNRELEEKQKMIVFFKEHQKLLKSTNHKITNGNIQEMQSEYLSFQNETTLLGVIGFAVFYNIRIFIVDASKKIYIDFHLTDESLEIQCNGTPPNVHRDKTCVLFKNKGIKGSTKYMIDISSAEDVVSNIEKTMLCLEHYTKPLRSISTYKVCELEEIATLLNIEYSAKCKKPELYEKISHYCSCV